MSALRDDKGRFVPGSSGNPNGRPRSGAALAETIRAELDPSTAVNLLTRYIADEGISLERRLSVLLPWLQAGYLRPPTSVNAHVTSTQTSVDVSGLSDAEINERLAWLQGRALTAPDQGQQPYSVLVGTDEELPNGGAPCPPRDQEPA